MTRPRLIAVLALTVGLLAQACTASERMVRLPDGRRINLACAGKGSPTVLLEGGYRASAGGWWKVQPLVARFTRVCAYDRAGYGKSDPGPFPRDGAAVARDLDATLKAAKIAGPFVVVGHSAGGLYMRLFSDLRPRDVVGMVLIDTSVEHQDRRFAEVFGPGAGGTGPLKVRAEQCFTAAEAGVLPSTDPGLAYCTPKKPKAGETPAWREALAEETRPTTWSTAVSELDTLWADTSDEVDKGRAAYGDMPLIVLTASGTYDEGPPAARAQAEALWRRLHQEVAARSSRGQERLVEGSSHMMTIDRPDAVADAVREVVDQTRGVRPAP
jgi:pimeloyl-ACP methyl ester carboxylesterase